MRCAAKPNERDIGAEETRRGLSRHSTKKVSIQNEETGTLRVKEVQVAPHSYKSASMQRGPSVPHPSYRQRWTRECLASVPVRDVFLTLPHLWILFPGLTTP